MARQLVSSYSFDPRARTVTLTGLATVDKKCIVSIINQRTGENYYLRQDAARVQLTGKMLTLPVGVITISASPSDPLLITYDPALATATNAITLPDIAGLQDAMDLKANTVDVTTLLAAKADAAATTTALGTKLDKLVGTQFVYRNDGSGNTGALTYSANAGVGTIVQRDANGNILADAFVPSMTTVVSAAGTTVMTVDSTEVIQVTGTLAQTVQLPTTSVQAGQRYTVINASSGTTTVQSSGANVIFTLSNGHTGIFTALVATPTTAAHWGVQYIANVPVRSSATASAIAQRDGNGGLLASAFIPTLATTATASGTTTLTAGSPEVQAFTGTLTQTVQLPTTSVIAGQRYTIINQSTNTVTVTASGGATVVALSAGVTATFTAAVATPTLPAHWAANTGYAANISTGPQSASLALRNGSASLTANAFLPNFATTVAAGGTTTLTVASAEVQEITGTAAQTVALPTTNIVAGQRFTIINSTSTSSLSINASGGAGVATLPLGQTCVFTALVATPTLPAHWGVALVSQFSHRTTAVGSSVALRDSNASLFANSLVPSFTTTATAGGTTALTVASAQEQEFTGTLAQTVTLPTTGVVAGQSVFITNRGTTAVVTVNSSNGNLSRALYGGDSYQFTARIATPVTGSDWTARNMGTAVWTTATTPSTVAMRDGNSNLLANALIPNFATIATAAGTTTLTVSSAEVQTFTGSTTQTVTLPTTGIVAGQRYTIVNQSSGVVTVNSSAAGFVSAVTNGMTTTVIALQAAPTLSAHWSVANAGFYTPNPGVSANSIAVRDGVGRLAALQFIPNLTSTVTAAGTLTMLHSSTEIQVFTGTTTHIVTLPTASTGVGQRWSFLNQSTGAITINASGGGLVKTLAAGVATEITSLQVAPTLPAHWFAT